MRQTRPGTLAALAVIAAAVGWTGIRVWSSAEGGLPQIPRAAPFALLFLAAVLAAGALLMRRRVRRRQPGTPMVSADFAVRLLVLGQASAIVGALMAGAYLGFAAFYAAALDVPFRRTAALWSLATTGASVVVILTAIWLERECRVPPDDDEELTGQAAPA